MSASLAGTLHPVVLVFGTVCLDRVRRVPSLAPPGGYVEIESVDELLGGEAANTAASLTAWGIEVQLWSNPLGCGGEADRLHRLLAEKGLRAQEAGASDFTPVTEIFVTPNGERTMYGHGFAAVAELLRPEAVPIVPDAWFTAEPNMGSSARAVVRRALEAGTRAYVMDFFQEDDPIPAGGFWQSSTDWVGVRGNTQRNVAWVDAWVGRHGCQAVLSDGPNGFVYGAPGRRARAYPPFPAPEVVDTTGAGDMFRAGMLYGLSLGWDVADCLRFASAAGCLKCRAFGATGRIPPVAEVQSFVAAHPQVAAAYAA